MIISPLLNCFLQLQYVENYDAQITESRDIQQDNAKEVLSVMHTKPLVESNHDIQLG